MKHSDRRVKEKAARKAANPIAAKKGVARSQRRKARSRAKLLSVIGVAFATSLILAAVPAIAQAFDDTPVEMVENNEPFQFPVVVGGQVINSMEELDAYALTQGGNDFTPLDVRDEFGQMITLNSQAEVDAYLERLVELQAQADRQARGERIFGAVGLGVCALIIIGFVAAIKDWPQKIESRLSRKK